MPWKPPTSNVPKCVVCGKSVYPTEKIECLSNVYHKGCFKCSVSGVKLTMNSYRALNGVLYHEKHYPKGTGTAIADSSQFAHVRQQSVRQSTNAYKAKYEKEVKGSYTATAEGEETMRVRAQSQLSSNNAYKAKYEKDVKGKVTSYAEGGTDASLAATSAAAHEAKDVLSEPNAEPAPAAEEPAPAAEEPAPAAEEPAPAAEEPAPAAEEPAPAAEEPADDGKKWVSEYDYDAADADEVSFKEGDVIIKVKVVDEGWVTGTVERTGESGMLPSNYIVEKPAEDAAAAAAAEPEPAPAAEEPAPAAEEPAPAAEEPAPAAEEPAPAAEEPAPAAEEPAAEPEPAAEEPAPAAEEPAAEPEAAAAPAEKWKAEYDYTAADADEVSFKEDDIIINVKVVDEGWVTGTVESSGESGMLPSNYIVKVE